MDKQEIFNSSVNTKFFGLLGREDDYVLPWQSIVRIGSDIILVDCKGEVSRRKRRRRSLI